MKRVVYKSYVKPAILTEVLCLRKKTIQDFEERAMVKSICGATHRQEE